MIVAKYFGCTNVIGITIMGTDLSLTLGRIIDQFVIKDIVKVNGIKIFIVKQMFKEGGLSVSSFQMSTGLNSL